MTATANRPGPARRLARMSTPWLLLLLTVPSLPSTRLHAQQRQITVTGLVRDAGSGRPVVASTVVFDGLVVAETNETGEYEKALALLRAHDPSIPVVDEASVSLRVVAADGEYGVPTPSACAAVEAARVG